MARLASAAKLGYYPTPPEVLKLLKSKLDISPKTRFLDPCCGDGEALAELVAGHDVETWGIELEKQRYKVAKARLCHVLWADALTEITYRGPSAFDVLYLNPPYDYEAADEDVADRLELRFLQRYVRMLAPQGLLIGLFPDSSLRSQNMRAMLSVLTGLKVYAVPPEMCEGADYRQLLVLAVKKRTSKPQAEANNLLLKQVATEGRRVVEPLECCGPIEVPLVHSDRPFSLTSKRIDPVEVYEEVCRSKCYPAFFQHVSPPSLGSMEPLAPLRKGHLASLVAAGFCNGAVISDPETGQRFVVKGRIARVTENASEEETEKGTVQVVRHFHKTSVTLLDLTNVELTELQ